MFLTVKSKVRLPSVRGRAHLRLCSGLRSDDVELRAVLRTIPQLQLFQSLEYSQPRANKRQESCVVPRSGQGVWSGM